MSSTLFSSCLQEVDNWYYTASCPGKKDMKGLVANATLSWAMKYTEHLRELGYAVDHAGQYTGIKVKVLAKKPVNHVTIE